MGRAAARIIYEAVFLPRITYAAEIWAENGCSLKKSIAALLSMQRDPLRAITSCYKTASTNCLSVLIAVMIEEGVTWPPDSGAFLSSRRTYEALRKFSKDSLTNRDDR
ncbi:unnamed protein product [Macrosiphum euphorbiae]|uniref:Uncharacterized protein n=1 Tax=Macrosiphum euphorbiae TaxID=13131 RepID=A0AAV0XPJ3_9HEMI|nr:unnamed protein product [Macrosiphum euphorbiae]